MIGEQQAVSLYLELLKSVLTASIYEESAWEVKRTYPSKPLERLLAGKSRDDGLLLVRPKPLNKERRAEGRDWPMFGYTMIGRHRLDNLQSCVEDVLQNGVPGDLIETGSWRGGAAIFMRALLKVHAVSDRRIWVADSFEGLPVPEDENDGPDLSDVDYLKVSLEQVEDNFRKFGLLDDQVTFLKGWFSDTLPEAPIERLAVLRLDGDLYSSTMDALRNLYSKVSPGGYVIIDDYNDWAGCKQAVTDFLSENDLRPEVKPIDWTGIYWQVHE